MRVCVRVEADDDAHRICGVLEALGYDVVRDHGDGSARQRRDWATQRTAARYRLSARESTILGLVLEGLNNEEIGAHLELSRATIKWHMYNIHERTSTTNREALLRVALQLDGGAR